MKGSRYERETFNVDEQNTHRIHDAMAAARRQESGRVFSIIELIGGQYF
jgi:hypothetical protein